MNAITGSGSSDEELIQQHTEGNTKALSVLYSRYYDKVYHRCLSFTKNRDDAFDLTQDVLLKAFSKISSFKGNARFSTWLYAIAQNTCITHVSKMKMLHFDDLAAHYQLMDESSDSEALQTRADFENKELKLQEMLASVSELDRDFLHLKYNRNYSVKDLQLQYQLSASAVKMRLLRARQKVEQCFYQKAV